MKRIILTIFLLIVLSFSALPLDTVRASGFGVTPPYVINDGLTRNSIYEQRIHLVRGDPNQELLAQVEIDVPGADEWITIQPGNEFLLPPGQQRVTMTVRVQVPSRADFGRYTGAIRVTTSPTDSSRPSGGAVSIALGARINVDMRVIDRVIHDFNVRSFRLDPINEGRHVWWLYFPGKIRFAMEIENIGNVDVAPTRVEMDIYDIKGEKLLESTVNTNRIKKVPPFQFGTVEAHLPTKLKPGSYIAHFTIYNHDEIKRTGELTLNVRPYGTITGDTGYGFAGLSLWHKTTIIGPLVLLFLLVFGSLYRFAHGFRRRLHWTLALPFVGAYKCALGLKCAVAPAFSRARRRVPPEE
jgi:hypothetical protein